MLTYGDMARLMRNAYPTLGTVDEGKLKNWCAGSCERLLGAAYMRKKKYGKPSGVRISPTWFEKELEMAP